MALIMREGRMFQNLVEYSLFRSPCDNCRKEQWCEIAELVCNDFLHYVETGEVKNKDRVASRVLYQRLYSEEDKHEQ